MAAIAPMPSNGLRVLIVEDHELSAFLLTHFLSKAGHRCEVTTQAEAAAWIAGHSTDVIVYEWYRAYKPALGFARDLRKIANGRELFIVALSTQIEPEGFRHLEDVDAYLVKPFHPEAVTALLEQVSRTRRR